MLRPLDARDFEAVEETEAGRLAGRLGGLRER
jgi:hypothetical protein